MRRVGRWASGRPAEDVTFRRRELSRDCRGTWNKGILGQLGRRLVDKTLSMRRGLARKFSAAFERQVVDWVELPKSGRQLRRF
jgi:hypothetical protein